MYSEVINNMEKDIAEMFGGAMGYIASVDMVKYPVFENGKVISREPEETFRVRVGNSVYTYKAKYFKKVSPHHWKLDKDAI